jgi:hypothetical protein
MLYSIFLIIEKPIAKIGIFRPPYTTLFFILQILPPPYTKKIKNLPPPLIQKLPKYSPNEKNAKISPEIDKILHLPYTKITQIPSTYTKTA